MIPPLSHADSAVGALLGLSTSLTLATTPEAVAIPWQLQMAISCGAAVLPFIVKAFTAWIRGDAKGDRVRANQKRVRAGKLRTAGDTKGADTLELEADELDAKAAEKETAAGETK